MKLFISLLLSATYLPLLLDGQYHMKIFGGKQAQPHSRPYMVYIKTQNHICGGILIHPQWVLTAAHCDIDSEEKVVLGAHSISQKENEKQDIKIQEVIKHEKYNAKTFDFDIALLKLSEMAKLTQAVKPLPLKNVYKPVRRTVCKVAGWGATSTGKNSSDVLKEANVTIIDDKACFDYWNGTTTENMICTSEKENTETCTGDSGGPLICMGVLRGIISSGELKCGVPGNVAVYTDLNCNIVSWIKKHQCLHKPRLVNRFWCSIWTPAGCSNHS